MSTDISNAVGTARQFTPQPDGVYQGRYQGLGVSQASAVQSHTVDLADSMAKLSDALQSYTVSHEKYLNATGEIEATAMINGMSEGAIEKLNVIDAAQLEGYADSVANPYFNAYAEKLRGTFLSSRAKQDYDAKYAMEPAKSAEEELKRYSNFMQDWKNTNIAGAGTRNQLAFDRGFYENSLVNMGNLASTWNKKKNEEDVVVTMANMQNELGDVIKDSANLLKENGAMTKKVQAIFNEGRLMGLPPQYRQKLLDDFTQEIVKTGHIPEKKLAQMLDNVVIQTSMDGSTLKASDLVDMQTLKTAASQYNHQFMTQQKYEFIQKYRKMGKGGYLAAINEIDKMREEDPEKAQEYNGLISTIKSEIDQDEAKKAAALRSTMGVTGGEGGSGSPSTGNGNSGLKDPAVIGSVIDTWVGGGMMHNGVAINSYKFNTDAMYPVVWQKLNEYALDGNTDAFFRLMDMKQVGDLKSSFGADLASKLATIKPSDDGGVNIGGDPTMVALVKMITTNPNNVEHSFGADVANQARIIKSLVDLSGDFDSGLRMFANYNNADPDVVSNNRDLVKAQINGYTIEGVQHLDSRHNAMSYDTVSFNSNMNADLRDTMSDLATALTTSGMTPYDAVNKAGSIISDTFTTYHWGAFPKACYSNMGTEDDAGWFSHGLDQLCYAAAGDGNSAEGVHISYNRTTQMFYASDWNNGGAAEMSLSQVREIGINNYNDAIKYMTEHPQESSRGDNYNASADEINETRARTDVTDVVDNGAAAAEAQVQSQNTAINSAVRVLGDLTGLW